MKQAKKREKNFSPEFRSYPTRARKFQKILQNNSQNKKTSLRHYFYQNLDEIGLEREKKVLVLKSDPTQPGLQSYQKNSKKFKKLKNIIPTLFVSKSGWDTPRKRENNFSPEFRSHPTQARKFQKN